MRKSRRPTGGITLALSVKQPFAEQILRGAKKVEYRSRRTNLIGRRFYIYASMKPRPDADFRRAGLTRAELPTGVLVGSAVIAGCVRRNGRFEWLLSSVRRLRPHLKPKRHPQPVWFRPF